VLGPLDCYIIVETRREARVSAGPTEPITGGLWTTTWENSASTRAFGDPIFFRMSEEAFSEDEYEQDDSEMWWETEARDRVKAALEHVRFDEIRGVVYAMSGEDHKINCVEEEFGNYE
jgi:hypothetical protein